MRFSAIIAGATLASAALLSANSASAVATVLNGYDNGNDNAYLAVTNNDSFAYTDVNIGGSDFGALAAGATTGNFNAGDNESGSNGSFVVTITSAAGSASGSFADGENDIDVTDGAHSIGTLAVPGNVPEPAAWALMLVGFAGLGGALRSRRGASIAA